MAASKMLGLFRGGIPLINKGMRMLRSKIGTLENSQFSLKAMNRGKLVQRKKNSSLSTFVLYNLLMKDFNIQEMSPWNVMMEVSVFHSQPRKINTQLSLIRSSHHKF
ncbi:hypothetical protein FGO68_gene7046 [Halteria grandinella]|uniref:Uncharacterized protein n=1 Tax=Halteria grandinella TaxID=5974 RepID=A0A8J8NR70_HALGN|nr:hypothetical protein FGO68_gene7046 [Halteria grandinella]